MPYFKITERQYIERVVMPWHVPRMKGHDPNEFDWGGIRGNEEGRLAQQPI